MGTIFEWDSEKAESNFKKHGIRFEDALPVFLDPLAVSHQDRLVRGEKRWQTVGMSGSCLLLIVAHTLRDENDEVEVVRIINARRVTRTERRIYEHGKV